MDPDRHVVVWLPVLGMPWRTVGVVGQAVIPVGVIGRGNQKEGHAIGIVFERKPLSLTPIEDVSARKVHISISREETDFPCRSKEYLGTIAFDGERYEIDVAM